MTTVEFIGTLQVLETIRGFLITAITEEAPGL
jgi:hypothetical protein